MARRGSSKDLSVRHEEYIAELFQGDRSQSSGAAPTDPGDVRTEVMLIECKASRPARKPTLMQQLEKIAQEAWEHGLQPAVALRWYCPDSPLASNGYVDVLVRLADDDVWHMTC